MTTCPENCINCLMDNEAEEIVEPWTDRYEIGEDGLPSE